MFNAEQRFIAIDPRTGTGVLRIPLGTLWVDEAQVWGFNIDLSCTTENASLNFDTSGSARFTMQKPLGKVRLSSLRLVLYDGRKVELAVANLERVLADGYMVDIAKSLERMDIVVHHKNGVTEVFDISYADKGEGELVPVGCTTNFALRTRFVCPSGRCLKFFWGELDGVPRITSIVDNDGTVLKAEWAKRTKSANATELKSLTLFPDTDEAVAYTASFKDSVLTVESKGAGILGSTRYRIKDSGGKLQSLTAELIPKSPEEADDVSTHSESLTYKDGKVSQHAIELGCGVDKRTEDYVYAADKTTITGKQGKLTATREYAFSDAAQVSEKVVLDGITHSSEQTITADEKRGVVVVKTTKKVGEAIVQATEMEFDRVGNLVTSTEGDQVTEYTYYNNYQSYEVIEKHVPFKDLSFGGLLFTFLDFNFLTAISIACGNGGFTFGSRLDTEVHMTVSANDYAKTAFHLPVEVKYPGDTRGFVTHLESILVYRKDGDTKHSLSLTYFGYDKFTPAKVELSKPGYVLREHVALPSLKLTVLQPTYEVADVSAEQLLVAKKAAKAFLDSLEKQKASASDKAGKEACQATIDSLNKSLGEQSKANARGFKLGKWASGMQVEALTYHTDSSKPGFGQLKTTSLYLLDAEGNEVANSRIKTSFDYSVDSNDKRKLTVKTEVATADKISVNTSLTRSSLTGRLFESVDGEGVKTVLAYANGVTGDVTVSQGDRTIDKVTHALTAIDGKLFQYQSSSSLAADHSRLVRDALGREVSHWLSTDGSTWLKMSENTYDASGRGKSLTEYDYDAAGTRTSSRTTSWAYEGAKTTATLVLKDASDKETERKTQVMELTASGQSLTFGSFKLQRTYDQAQKTLTEDFGGAFRVRQSFDDAGFLKSVKYLTVGSDKKETEEDALDFGYDPRGKLTSFKPKIGGNSTYTFDVFGRLLTATNGGTEVRNVYSAANTSEVALEGHAKDGSGEFALGTQTVDGLGRTKSQTVNGTTTSFAYKGSSHWSKASDAAGLPGTLAGYESTLTAEDLTYVESITRGEVVHSSTTTYSRRGTVLKFEGLLGGATTYDYDIQGRLVKSANSSCEATFTYGDNSLLTKETIKALKNNLTMTVTYTYNSMGEETSRKFVCSGFDTLECLREVMGDGRLNKHTLKVKDKELRSDSYTYDDCNRLSTWSCTGEGVRNHEGKCYVSESFGYDVLGDVVKRENKSYTDPIRPATLTSSTSTYKFDKNMPGAITASGTSTMVEDAAGRLMKRVNRNITYHPNGQVKTYSATADGKGGDYEFAYDDLGMVRGGKVGNYSDTYHYRGNRIYALVQVDSDKKYGFSSRTLVLQNDSPSCWMQDVSTTVDKTETNTCTFELRDSAGSVFASLDLGKTTITYFVYSPFGYRNPDPSSVTWRGFKGDPLNMLSLYYLGSYRLYDPQLHRFQTPDCRSPFGVGGISRYAFCGSDPVNYHDPSGHQLVAQYSRLSASPWIHTDAFRIVAAVVGVILAPFTGGASLAFTIAATGFALASLGFEIASVALEKSDPKLARIMGGLGMAFGLMSVGVGSVGSKLAALSAASRVGAVGRLANEGADAATLIGETVYNQVERMNPALAGFDHIVMEANGAKFELYTAGPATDRLVISAHGSPVEGLSYAGTKTPVPEFFSTNLTEKVGFYADQGFKVHMQGHNYSDVLKGNYVPSNYYAPGKVPNYALTEFTTAEHLEELPALGRIQNFNASTTFGNLAQDLNVDYLRPLQPITTEQIFSTLEKAGYRYKVVDGLHCRGSISPGTSPSLLQKGLHTVFKGVDWWKGVKMVP
ncbi:RHS repeat domain-containing protein [Pseudomonas wadenswilerensis]